MIISILLFLLFCVVAGVPVAFIEYYDLGYAWAFCIGGIFGICLLKLVAAL